MSSKIKILVTTAVTQEKEAVLRGLKKNNKFDVIETGVGPVSAAISTTKMLATANYDLVVSTGIAGGFYDKAEVGSLVVADKIISADLGVETPEGFCSLDELALGCTNIEADVSLIEQVKEKLLATDISFTIGPVLTVSTVTGTTDSAAKLAARVPRATAEAMEGFGVALAAKSHNLPVLEVRAISNIVGPRDRAAWRVNEALEVLETAWTVLSEVLS